MIRRLNQQEELEPGLKRENVEIEKQKKRQRLVVLNVNSRG